MRKTQKAIAELSRPARELRRKWKQQNQKPQGRKPLHKPQNAIYHNWFTPFLWLQITQAARDAGWEMNPTKIVQIAKGRAPETFKGLTVETVRGWIDRSGDRPRWSDAALHRARKGNDVGHNKGGRQGVLVSLLIR